MSKEEFSVIFIDVVYKHKITYKSLVKTKPMLG